jgi:hypothetical protein
MLALWETVGRDPDRVSGRGFWPDGATHAIAVLSLQPYSNIDDARADILAALDEWYEWHLRQQAV